MSRHWHWSGRGRTAPPPQAESTSTESATPPPSEPSQRSSVTALNQLLFELSREAKGSHAYSGLSDSCGGSEAIAAAALARTRRESAERQGKLSWRQLLRQDVYEAWAAEDEAELRLNLMEAAVTIVQWISDIDQRD